MILKYLILGNRVLDFASESIKQNCEEILKIVQKKKVFPQYIEKSREIINNILSETEYEEKDPNKKVGFTKLVKEKAQSIDFKS